MNIKDSYLHGGTHVVKNIEFSIANSGTNNGKLVATITWAQEGANNTQVAIPISGATFGSQTKNTVFAAPSDAAGNPSFRTLVAADIPELGAGIITSGELGAARLPLATNSAKGAVILGVAADNTTNITGKLYWVKMNANGKIYVDVPWENNTWVANTKDDDGYVTAPKNGGTYLTNKVWKTDSSGNPGWRDDVNTWNEATTSQAGYIPQLTTSISSLSAASTDYVLAYTAVSGVTKPVWIKLPSNAYMDTWTAMVGASSSSNGSVGYINATPPKDGYNTKYWRADGSWAIPTNTTYKLYINTTETTTNAINILNETSTTTGYIITNSAYNASTNKIATMSDVTAAVGSVFILQGDTTTTPTGTLKVGYAYRASAAFTLEAANSVTGANQSVEIGDLLVCTNTTGPKFLVVNTNWSVSDSSPVLGASATTIATIGGVTISASLPTASRTSSDATAGIIALNPGTGTTKFLREDGTWVKPSYTSDTVRPIYVAETSQFTKSLKTAINFTGTGATTVTFESAGTGSGLSGSSSYANIKISSTDQNVAFTNVETNTSYTLALKAGSGLTALGLYYDSEITVEGGTITASLNGNAGTASNLSKGDGRGYLYQSAGTTTGYTGVGSVSAATEIGIPYIGYANNANTYGIYKDLFYLSGSTKYIGSNVHSTKFAYIKTTSNTDDWDNSNITVVRKQLQWDGSLDIWPITDTTAVHYTYDPSDSERITSPSSGSSYELYNFLNGLEDRFVTKSEVVGSATNVNKGAGILYNSTTNTTAAEAPANNTSGAFVKCSRSSAGVVSLDFDTDSYLVSTTKYALSGSVGGNALLANAVAGGVNGNILYLSGAGVTSFLANGTSGLMLKCNGDAAPSWETVENYTTTSIALANYSLSAGSWTTVSTALPTLTGTYALYIDDVNNGSYAGVFAIEGGAKEKLDEIPLHWATTATTTADTKRIYAAINSGKLLLASTNATATSYSLIIKYKRII